jgi:hypothetical protein
VSVDGVVVDSVVVVDGMAVDGIADIAFLMEWMNAVIRVWRYRSSGI